MSAVDGRDRKSVAREVAEATIAATAVGPNALPHIYPAIAAGLELRQRAGRPALDIIICENLRSASDAFAAGLRGHLAADFPLENSAGLIETSIGKMVPIMMPCVVRRPSMSLWSRIR